MGTTMASEDERIEVQLVRAEPPPSDPFAAFLALRDSLGVHDVYLLESLAGPASDRRTAAIGFRSLLEVEVRSGVVSLRGVESVVTKVRSAIVSSGVATADGLVLADCDGLWDLARVVQGTFELPSMPANAFDFGFFTFFGYDTMRYVERLPLRIAPSPDAPPDALFVVYQGIALFDLASGSVSLTVGEAAEWDRLDVDDLVRTIADAPADDDGAVTLPAPFTARDSTDEGQFLIDVKKCLDHIAVGDIYQVQLGHEIAIDSTADPIDVYRRLRSRNPSPYMCMLPLADLTVVGASPELFVRVEDDVVMMRPIAGTAPRGADDLANAANVERLRTDEKESAEHVMLVDLCRNDLSRIAQRSSVRVEELKCVENFSHVFHLVSTVVARRTPESDVYDVVRATFPAGTMTGAPKIRAMEIIEGTEGSRRGLYAGAFGLISFGGYANLGLCIRTLFHRSGTFVTRASAGVVADSRPEAEWRETLAKMNATYWSVTGQELL